jgi:hypothetical protein
MKKRLIVAVLACTAAVAVASVAWAAIGGDGIVKTCYKGTWKPISSTASCKQGETPLDFYTKSGADAAFLGNNGKAADSDLLDGIDSTGFLGATAKAADSDKLDGIDSTGFIQGTGTTTNFAVSSQTQRATPVGLLTLTCTGGGYSVQYVNNLSSSTADVWVEKSAAGTTGYTAVAGISVFNIIIGGFGDEHVTLRVSRGQNTATWDIWLTTTGTCHQSITETTGVNG